MNTQQVAYRLVELCRKGDFEAAQKELFANDAVSIEPYDTPDFAKETKGLTSILQKGEKWGAMVDKVNKLEVSDPVVAANSFAFTMHLDINMKDKRSMDISELCVYTVKDGKILMEEFFM
jgi:hypothetical protein